jgi:hypothetical protein
MRQYLRAMGGGISRVSRATDAAHRKQIGAG